MIAEKEKNCLERRISKFLGGFNPLSSSAIKESSMLLSPLCSEPRGRPRKRPSVDFVGPYWGLQGCLHNVDGSSEYSLEN